MLNTLWTVLLLAGIGWGTLTGNARATGEALLEGAASGVSLCMTMFGVLALWSGILEIASTSGLMDAISRRMRPLLHWLFPRIPDGHPALAPIAANLTANLFGLGWAATPAGLAAMEALVQLEEERRSPGFRSENEEDNDTEDAEDADETQIRTASDEMCTFVILNTSSLQLIPVTMIAYRSQYGSANPTAIVLPVILATSISTIAALIFCKVKAFLTNQREAPRIF